MVCGFIKQATTSNDCEVHFSSAYSKPFNIQRQTDTYLTHLLIIVCPSMNTGLWLSMIWRTREVIKALCAITIFCFLLRCHFWIPPLGGHNEERGNAVNGKLNNCDSLVMCCCGFIFITILKVVGWFTKTVFYDNVRLWLFISLTISFTFLLRLLLLLQLEASQLTTCAHHQTSDNIQNQVSVLYQYILQILLLLSSLLLLLHHHKL